MKKIYFIQLIAAITLLLGACDYNDRNFEGLDDMVRPGNVFTMDYALTDADYAAISSNKTNEALAKDSGVTKELGYVKTDLYLSEKIPGELYIPAFLAGKYIAADNGSSVKVAYKFKEGMSDLLSTYSGIKYLKLADADYKLVYGETAFAPYLNASTEGKLSKILNENFKDVEKNTVVFAEYKSGEGQLENPLMWEGFESLETGDLKAMDGWFVSSEGGAQWKVTAYDENQYVQYTANGTKGACVGWLVSKPVTVGADDYLGFDVNVGYYNAACLSVLVSEDFDGSNVNTANWDDVTASFIIPNQPTGSYGTLASAGKVSLAGYSGKKIYVAFKYTGDGANKKTTTYQIDNVMIGSSVPEKSLSVPVYVLNIYDGKNWKVQNAKVYVPTFEDYGVMGQSKRYFTSDAPAANYLPNYLSKMVAYPVDGDSRVVVYRFNNGKELKIYSDEYVYSGESARWGLNTRVVDRKEQFVRSNGKWNYDPSTVVTLNAVKNDPLSTPFYQYITDWVKENKGAKYVTTYGNNDYYYGGSAYNNNFDFRLSAWRTQSDEYKEMSDEDLTNLMFARLPEAFVPALVKFYGDAKPVAGIEVVYTINFSIYDGKTTDLYTIQYVVTGEAKFDYKEDSLKKVEKV